MVLSCLSMPNMVSEHSIGTMILNITLTLRLDALPGLGHACGHNLIATASVGGALATAEIMRAESLPGKVILFGTPAEESKIDLEKSESG